MIRRLVRIALGAGLFAGVVLVLLKVAEWRERMATPEAKAIYKERASTAECVNAQARNRGLQQLTVRGRAKAKAVVLWYVLAHNMLRIAALRALRGKEAAQAS